MAEVFRAEALGLQGFKKQVAIKRVLAHLATKESFIKMFLDEARLSARLSHSNCVQVFDIGVGDGTYFIVMEFVDGANLRGIIDTIKAQNRPFPAEEACYIAIELCKGLQYAHYLPDEHGVPLGIVHRDMSPPNVLITKHGEVKIVDFGLAKAHTQLEKSEPGVIKGKFSYLAPEAARGQEVDQRADIFAIGIMLWELLAGKRLFLGKTDLETVQMVQRAIIPPITRLRPDVPPELEPILARALASDPNQRYQSSRDLGTDLNAFLYRFGQHPVSDFEIADLVNSAMEHKRREREAQRGSGVEQFLQWAEQAVFQFESLQTGESTGARALDVGSLGIGLGAAPPINLGGNLRQTTRGIPNMPSAGDLSALEDDEPPPGGGGYGGGAPLHAQPAPVAPAQQQAVNAAAPATGAAEPKKGGVVGKLLLVIFALAAAAGGLWASGIIKH
ncbi:MAG: serine/threonine protein kinase [Deltaproteobacteria bacterium]|nr:serine/threonine protein kinase [Deltaproteobacteria bacterium]